MLHCTMQEGDGSKGLAQAEFPAVGNRPRFAGGHRLTWTERPTQRTTLIGKFGEEPVQDPIRKEESMLPMALRTSDKHNVQPGFCGRSRVEAYSAIKVRARRRA
jgi:hypothetical protein